MEQELDLVAVVQASTSLPADEQARVKEVFEMILEHGGKEIDGEKMTTALRLAVEGWALVGKYIVPCIRISAWMENLPPTMRAARPRYNISAFSSLTPVKHL